MIRRVLLTAAGLFTAVCVACAPEPVTPPPPPLPQPMQPVACAYDNIGMLPANFPNPKDPHFTPVSSGMAPPNIVADVKRAVALAPPFFQVQLCQLDGIFIAPPGGESWGVRNPRTGKKYVALSYDLWSSGTPPDLATHATRVIHRLLTWNGPHSPNFTSQTNDPAVTVLDVLAHEYGHVLFYETFVRPPETPPQFNNPDFFCGGKFYQDSWQLQTLPQSTIPWRHFTDTAGLHLPNDIQISDIQSAPPTPSGKGNLVSLFYSEDAPPSQKNGHGRWASLFAGFTPDHDFVETFKLFVLMKSRTPPTTLKLNVETSQGMQHYNIHATCGQRSTLKDKLGCFQQQFCANSTANACNSNCVPLAP
jgi:hypothetical protein